MVESSKYTRVAMALHWLTVGFVGALYGVGWTMVDLPKGPGRGEMFALHKTLGITVLLLTFLRLAWRLSHRPPTLPAELPRWRVRMATGVHHAFYGLLVLQPVLGYCSSWFSGRGTRFLGLELPMRAARDAAMNDFFSGLHELGAAALLCVITLHVVGAVSHGVRGPGALLRRMSPW